jgi:mevalonate kinase
VPVTQVHADAAVTDSTKPGIWIDAPAIDLHAAWDSLPPGHPLAAVLQGALAVFRLEALPSLRIEITSTIPLASGLGSGAAVSVALVRALAAHLGHAVTDEQVNAIAFEVERIHHGTPSGIDNTVITYGRPVYFIKGRPIQTLQAGGAYTIVIGDTGIPAPTRTAVGDVRRRWEADPEPLERIFNQIGEIAQTARRKMEHGEGFGSLMDHNHALLQELGVSSPELDRLVQSARRAGALGAKMSGGGRGGNMLALVDPQVAATVAGALEAAGARHTITTTIRP